MAQETELQLRTAMELSAEIAEDATDTELWAEDLGNLLHSPLRLNFVTADELAALRMLDIFQISNLLMYREKTGMIFSHYELMQVKGFDRELIEMILPYLDFSTSAGYSEFKLKDLRSSRHEISLRYQQNLESRRGFTPQATDPYLGPAFGSQLRYRGRFRDLISFGACIQNDAGEPIGFNYQTYFFDHASWFIAINDLGRMRKIILGDFLVSYGQGLAIWNGGGFGGTGNYASSWRYGKGIQAYAGAEETRFYRGMAAQIKLSDQWQLEAFLSLKSLDARLISEEGEPDSSGTLLTDGLHRTARELQSKDNNRLFSAGGQLKWHKEGLAISLQSSWHHFRFPVPQADQLYNRFRFSGEELGNMSLHLHYLRRSANWYAEIATDHKGALCFTGGLESELAPGFRLAVSTRYFDLKYQSFRAAPPAIRGSGNEMGLYSGVHWEIRPRLHLSASLDSYQFTWISYRADAPSAGSNGNIMISLPLSRKLKINLGLRSRLNELNKDGAGQFRYTEPYKRTNIRAEIRYQVTPSMLWSWRTEKSALESEEKPGGLLIMQDLRYEIVRWKLILNLRLAMLDIPDYETRIYAYESDLLYRFSIPGYYGQGFRRYLTTRWQINAQLSLECKLARSSFYDRQTIGSGNQEIAGSTQTDIAFQLRMKW